MLKKLLTVCAITALPLFSLHAECPRAELLYSDDRGDHFLLENGHQGIVPRDNNPSANGGQKCIQSNNNKGQIVCLAADCSGLSPITGGQKECAYHAGTSKCECVHENAPTSGGAQLIIPGLP